MNPPVTKIRFPSPGDPFGKASGRDLLTLEQPWTPYLLELTQGEVEPAASPVNTIRAQRRRLRRVPSEGLQDGLTELGNATLG